MKFKKIVLPFVAGALALSLAACNDEDKATKEETPKQETASKDAKQETPKAPSKEELAEMQAKLDEQQVDKSKIVAIVNDEELKGDQYNQALMSIQGQMQQMGQDPTSKEASEQIKTQTLDTLVNQTLIRQKADEAKLTATEEEINKEYTTYEEQVGGEEAMAKALEAQKMDKETLKEQIADSIVFGKYQDKVAPAKEVTDEEIQAYYDQAVAQAEGTEQKLPPLEEASEEIKGILEQQQQQELFAAHVEKLKADAKIELKI
ncbi:SurA N-terminal domain-containing protein [Paenisporosarcina sp.]|uniref:SurA N-terminal domain-containing protein n=1 Tax=Paenisporosarcina sp. TaxID=1932001 RepID=UPI003C764DD6